VEVHKANGMRQLHLGSRIESPQFAVIQGGSIDHDDHCMVDSQEY
jgi:hypothetical protein